MNEVLGLQTGGLTSLHTECGLVDVCLQKHGVHEFTTYQRGTKIIDYILVDRNILQCTQAIGYEPFGLHILSDHRGIFLNIATPQCFGSSILPIQPLQLRDLSTKRSHQIAPYFQAKTKHLEEHSWFTKVEALRVNMKQDHPNHTLAEDLYERLIAASIYAGSTLKKFPPAPYSPTIARLRNIHQLLKLAVTQFRTSKDMTESIARTKAKLGDAGYQLPNSLTHCTQALASCTRQLKAAIRDETETHNLRRHHQTQLIEKHEAAGNSKMAKKIRGMQRAEATKKVFQKCRAAQNIGTEGGLTHVMIPANPTDHPRTCTTWKRIDDPTEMTHTLMEWNQAHFGQSKGCTLTTPPLDFTMAFTATCARADAILEGTYIQPSTPSPLSTTPVPNHTDSHIPMHIGTDGEAHPNMPYHPDDETDTPVTPCHQPLHLQHDELPELVSLLIDSFRYATTPDAVPPELTEDEYKGKLKAWDESTSTSPSSHMHLGHLKAYWADHTLEDKNEAIDLESKRKKILDGHLTLLNYAIHFGYSFDKWKCIINTMLEKDKGIPKIH